ncbi:CBS domain-containing protein [Desulfobacterota bacterium AH_259_B03_O07]|nr:CBS domain-containing protein [Desulfobacterota bacterium AH_259_B03_O07]
MLKDLKVRDLIGERDRVYFVDAEDSVDVAALKLKNFKVRTIGVRRKGEIAGVVGQSDFSTKVVAMSKNPCEIKVEHIMTTKLRAVGLDSSFYECLELMDTNNISHLIILDAEGKYYGMLSWKDLKERLIKELKYQLELTQEYAFGPNVKDIDYTT